MSKIFLTESHIRQIVKETLENLILGEDYLNDYNINTVEDAVNIIKNLDNDDSAIFDMEYMDANNKDVSIVWHVKHNNMDVIFDIRAYVNCGWEGRHRFVDTYTEPEEPRFTIHNIEIKELYININDEIEKTFNIDKSDIDTINYLNRFIDEDSIIEKLVNKNRKI